MNGRHNGQQKGAFSPAPRSARLTLPLVTRRTPPTRFSSVHRCWLATTELEPWTSGPESSASPTPHLRGLMPEPAPGFEYVPKDSSVRQRPQTRKNPRTYSHLKMRTCWPTCTFAKAPRRWCRDRRHGPKLPAHAAAPRVQRRQAMRRVVREAGRVAVRARESRSSARRSPSGISVATSGHRGKDREGHRSSRLSTQATRGQHTSTRDQRPAKRARAARRRTASAWPALATVLNTENSAHSPVARARRPARGSLHPTSARLTRRADGPHARPTPLSARPSRGPTLRTMPPCESSGIVL